MRQLKGSGLVRRSGSRPSNQTEVPFAEALPHRWKRALGCLLLGLGCASPLLAQLPDTQTDCSDPINSGSAACQTTQPSSMQQPGDTSARPQVSYPGSQTGLGGSRPTDNGQVYTDAAGLTQHRSNGNTQTNRPNELFPPEPLTDFQRLARSATGEMLPIFGRDLFQRAPSTFAPADQIPVTADYVVGPGDEVLVRLFGSEPLNSQLTIDTAGSIYIPKVGSIHVAGLRFDELQPAIAKEINRVYRNYRLSVSLGHLRSIQVYVVGEARRPGAYTISSLSTVLNALFASGGPDAQGSLRRIQVRRAGQTLPDFDLYDLVLRGDQTHDIRLQAGDTLFIPPVGPQAALAGSVRHPAIYELKDRSTVEDLLTLAGGLSATGVTTDLRLERIEDDHTRQAMKVALNSTGKDMLLHDGDVLYAGHISDAYQQSVTIRGNLANPGRFGWREGMRLSDIIPDRKSLLTNDYWRERNRLGLPVPLFEPMQPTPPNGRTPGMYPNGNPQGTGYGSGNAYGGAGNAYGGTGNMNPNGDPSGYGSDTSRYDGSLPVDPNATTALGTNPAADAATAAVGQSLFGGQITPSAPNTAVRYGNANRDNVGASSATLPLPPSDGRERAKNRIAIPAPEIDWSYAVIERLNPTTLKSELVPFNLGKLVEGGDASQNLLLQPGDIVTILSQNDIGVPIDAQTKYVHLEGEFVASGVYSVAPGETLEQLIQRAGGFTSKAYLYGSSFSRESARVFQQQRLDEYITSLSADMERETAVRAASSSTGILDPNSLNEQRDLVAQLRSLRATGRVVLEFQPNSTGVASVPSIPLENGDVFRVPSRPNTVSVVGAVYGQNIYLYNPNRRLDDYIALAGEPNRIADRKHAFIIRADGSVYSRERAQGVLSNHFDAASINPGDAIVIPEKLIKPTALRQLLDYSQILSSFGLAAAGIEVLK